MCYAASASVCSCCVQNRKCFILKHGIVKVTVSMCTGCDHEIWPGFSDGTVSHFEALNEVRSCCPCLIMPSRHVQDFEERGTAERLALLSMHHKRVAALMRLPHGAQGSAASGWHSSRTCRLRLARYSCTDLVQLDGCIPNTPGASS